jgi:hypothetical protein
MLDFTSPTMVSYQATVGMTQLEYILRRRSEGILVAVQLVTDKPAKILFVQPDGTDSDEVVAYENMEAAVAAIQLHHDELIARYAPSGNA